MAKNTQDQYLTIHYTELFGNENYLARRLKI